MLRGITYNDMLCGSCLFFTGEIFHELSTFEGITPFKSLTFSIPLN